MLHKKNKFFAMDFYLVNVNKSTVSCGFVHIYWKILNKKLHFLVSDILTIHNENTWQISCIYSNLTIKTSERYRFTSSWCLPDQYLLGQIQKWKLQNNLWNLFLIWFYCCLWSDKCLLALSIYLAAKGTSPSFASTIQRI